MITGQCRQRTLYIVHCTLYNLHKLAYNVKNTFIKLRYFNCQKELYAHGAAMQFLRLKIINASL